MELKLTQVARASLEELKLDYEDFLRQRRLVQWPEADLRRQDLIDRRCQTANEVARWVVEISRQSQPSTTSTQSTASTYPEVSANAVLVLLAVACPLLDRQVERLAKDFEDEGGFSERLYRVRSQRR